MRKFIVTLMASLLSCSAAFAFWPEATDSSLEIGVGYRQDRLEWKTSSHFDSSSSSSYGYEDYGIGFPARLRSHLKWRDLEIWQIEARGTYVTCDNIYLRANGDYGWITDGKNTDKDFVTFDRHHRRHNRFSGSSDSSGSEFEFAHSKSDVDGHVYDAKIAIGYQFKLCDDSFSIAPLIGYSWHGQHLEDHHLKHDNINVDDYYSFENLPIVREKSHHHSSSSESSASFSEYSSSYSSSSHSHNKRHSKYHTRWDGFFLGFDFDYRFGCGCAADWELFGAYEFHWAEYHAKGHWHLREDISDGFHHRVKDAYGHVFDIGVKWDFCECWTLALKGEFQWWWADRGHDRAKFVKNREGNVHTDCFMTIPLHDVRWESASVSLDLGMVF
jgi:hypothetical protein